MVVVVLPVGQAAAALPPPALLVKMGQNVALHCPLLDNTKTVSSVSWYRKWWGRSPQLIVSMTTPTNGSDVTHGPGVAADKVLMGVDGSLHLTKVQLTDSANYFCCIVMTPIS